jgi:CRISPR/Cas system CMR-associated protein Cmr5 small subunit
MQKIINMEQIRAAGARVDAEYILKARGTSGDQLSGYHSLIITNGLLATLAYSTDKGGECRIIAESLIRHLAALQKYGRFPGECLPENLMDAIGCIAATATPTLLAMMTDECMAYLNYLKRFVRAMNKI